MGDIIQLCCIRWQSFMLLLLSTVIIAVFDQSSYDVDESDVYLEVCVIVNTTLLQQDKTVTVQTEDGSAMGTCSNDCIAERY